MTDYKKRLNLPLEGFEDIRFFTKSGTLVAKGYTRVVIGERGPYIEFNRNQVEGKNFFIPDDARYRLTDKRVYYIEARSSDESFVKIYYQKKTVKYADYKLGMCYISPFDLMSDKYVVEKSEYDCRFESLIDPLNKT